MLQERFETLPANAEPIFYRDVGAGSPLLLIHGSFSNGPTTWARQMEEIRHYHRLIVVDRRGHGQSPAEPRPYTIASDALDVLEAAGRAGGGEIHVVGHSYGGMVALEMARIEPHRIRSLHLIEPPYLSLMPEDSDVSSVIEQGQSIFRNAAIVGPEGTATAFMEMLIGPAALAELRNSPAWPGIVREAGRTAYEQFPVAYPTESLAELSGDFPVQVYTGGRSHPGLQKLARRLAELIPGAGLVEVPAATHAVQQFTEHFHPALLGVTAGRGRV